jgi:hypothetical protein
MKPIAALIMVTYVTHVIAIRLSSSGICLVNFLAKVPAYSDVAAQRRRFCVMLHLPLAR